MIVRRIFAGALIAVVLLLSGPGINAAVPDTAARAASYLAGRQRPDGGFFSDGQSADQAVEVAAALSITGVRPDVLSKALDRMRTSGPAATKRGGVTGRLVAGLVASGVDPHSFGGVDYVAKLQSFYDAQTGAHDASGLYANALAIIGLTSAGAPIPANSVTYMRANQCPTGGWSHQPGCGLAPDVDSTSQVVMAMRAAGVPSDDLSLTRARDFLSGAANTQRGFGQQAGDPTNANSTSLAISAIVALGGDPRAAPWSNGSTGPVEALTALQMPSGAMRYVASEQTANDYATVQSVPGLSLQAWPLKPAVAKSVSNDSTQAAKAPNAQRLESGAPPDASGNPTMVDKAKARRAGLVVFAADKELRRACVSFDDAKITGTDLLDRSGSEVISQRFAFGNAICSIDGTGCGSSDCLTCEESFWGYWTLEPGGDWIKSEVGADVRTVADGSVDAWVRGKNGDPSPPASLDIDAVCTKAAIAAAQSSPTPSPTATGKQASAVIPAVVAALVLSTAAGALVLRRRRMS